MAQALDFIVRDKKRHAQFGWLYLSQREAQLDSQAIVARAREMLERFYASGLMVPGFDRTAAADVADAIEIAAAAGLGAASLKDQRKALQAALEDSRQRFAALSIDAAALNLTA
jgi:hypothetical protein